MLGPLNLSLVKEAAGSIIARCEQGELQTGVLRCLLSVRCRRLGGKISLRVPPSVRKGGEKKGAGRDRGRVTARMCHSC